MKIWRSDQQLGEKYLTRLAGRSAEVFSPALEDKVRSVIMDVKKRGDKALTAYVKRFDLKGLKAAGFRLEGQVGAHEEVGEEFVKAVELTLANLRNFHEPQLPKGYALDQEGSDLSIRVRPLESVGIYVPGGGAVYLSSLLMAVVPALIAGVERIVVATPPRAFVTSPHLRYLLDRLDLREIYLMGGAHAIGALAFGTASVAAVDKIVGPGGRWVSAAKRAVYGVVDVDLIAGPSEIVIVADAHAEPEIIAADLLAQAEHDPDAAAVLITTSKLVAEKVNRKLYATVRSLPRDATARLSLRRWGAILLAPDLDAALDAVNRIAPEHVEVLVQDPLRFADGIERAGAVYLGPWSSVVLGDYVAGSNHVLPTAGAARFASPLGVWDFVRRTAVVRIAAHQFPKLARAARTLAELEELPFHARAVSAGSRGKR